MRSLIAISFAAIISAYAVTTAAQATSTERFTFARPPAPESTVDPKDRLTVDLHRWSSDAERDQMRGVLADGNPGTMLNAFRYISRVGTLQWPGGVIYGVHYARRISRADGGADIILAVDRPLWTWWDSSIPSTEYPFTVIQLRLNKDGNGEGRASFGVKIQEDKTAGVILDDFTKAPVLLTDVRSETGEVSG
jgi:hypothetical protein